MKLKLLALLLIVPAIMSAQSTSEWVSNTTYGGTATSTISTVLATGVACTDSTNQTTLLLPLKARKYEWVDLLIFGLNITDTVKIVQYSKTGDRYVNLKGYYAHQPNVAPGYPHAFLSVNDDTASTILSRVVVQPWGTTPVRVRVYPVTDGRIAINRGVNDTTLTIRWKPGPITED